MEFGMLDAVVSGAAVVASGVATFVALSIKPLNEKVNRHERMLENYGQFRGKVETLLDMNSKDHQEIKDDMKTVRTLLQSIERRSNHGLEDDHG